MRRFAFCIFILMTISVLWADFEVQVFKDIDYKSGPELSDYEKERCRLDLHVPKGKHAFPTLVWFHGGGIKRGDKANEVTFGVATTLAKRGLAIAAINYRLSPNVLFPAYIQDCAASIKWIHERIVRHGGDPKRIFVGGHSAGGYLAMILLDPIYFEREGLSMSDIAGFIPVSGQMVTHSTVREERNLSSTRIIVDQAAPLYHARGDLPPVLILAADNDSPMRLEENILMEAALKAAGNGSISLFVARERNHGSIVRRIPENGDPVAKAILDFVKP